MKLVASITTIVYFFTLASGTTEGLAITLPVEGLSYSEFPSDEEERVPTTDPRNWYSTAYCGKYLGYWQSRGEGSGSHPGVDIRVGIGTPIKAIARGKVVRTGAMWRWGDIVIIRHINMPGVPKGGPIYSIYAHLSKISVEEGDEVEEGVIIGLSGDTGISNIPHLHFQIDRHVKGAEHPFFPDRKGQCFKCEWLDPMHVVNHADTDGQVRRHTINPIKYISEFKDYRPKEQVNSNRPLKMGSTSLEEGGLYKDSGSEIYLYLDDLLHLIPDTITLSILMSGRATSEDNPTNQVTKVPGQVLFTIPHVQDIPPLRNGLLVKGEGPEVYIIQEREKKLWHPRTQGNKSGDNHAEITLVPEWVLESIPTTDQ